MIDFHPSYLGASVKRSLLSVLLVTMLLASRLDGEAQESKRIPRVGVLIAGHPPTRPSLEGFRQGLRDLGYIEGQNIVLELRWGEDNQTHGLHLQRISSGFR
jgi:hypothetical protein